MNVYVYVCAFGNMWPCMRVTTCMGVCLSGSVFVCLNVCVSYEYVAFVKLELFRKHISLRIQLGNFPLFIET